MKSRKTNQNKTDQKNDDSESFFDTAMLKIVNTPKVKVEKAIKKAKRK